MEVDPEDHEVQLQEDPLDHADEQVPEDQQDNVEDQVFRDQQEYEEDQVPKDPVDQVEDQGLKVDIAEDQVPKVDLAHDQVPKDPLDHVEDQVPKDPSYHKIQHGKDGKVHEEPEETQITKYPLAQAEDPEDCQVYQDDPEKHGTQRSTEPSGTSDHTEGQVKSQGHHEGSTESADVKGNKSQDQKDQTKSKKEHQDLEKEADQMKDYVHQIAETREDGANQGNDGQESSVEQGTVEMSQDDGQINQTKGEKGEDKEGFDHFESEMLKFLGGIRRRAKRRDRLYDVLKSTRELDDGTSKPSDWSVKQEPDVVVVSPWRMSDPRTWSSRGVLVFVTICWVIVLLNVLIFVTVLVNGGRRCTVLQQINDSGKTPQGGGQGDRTRHQTTTPPGGEVKSRRKRSSGFTGHPILEPYYIAVCTVSPCLEGGTCTVDNSGDLLCVCPPGYTGKYCHLSSYADVCGFNPCMNNGTCSEDVSTHNYTCNCTHGFEGRNCADRKDFCTPNPCKHDGRCYWSPEGFVCVCNHGHEGVTCDDEGFDYCASTPCLHGGACSVIPHVGPECNCTGTGYIGKYCQEDEDDCVSNPCGSNGICIDLLGGYRCTCEPHYTGDGCETELDLCAASLESTKYNTRVNSTICGPHGTCTPTGPGKVECTCKPGYAGVNCEVELLCQYDPCPSTSRCFRNEEIENKYECDHCASNPCYESPDPSEPVICISDTDHGWRCVCPSTLAGVRCDSPALKNTVTPDGSTCKDVPGGSDGVYTIQPDNARQPFSAYCDFTNGGFTLAWNFNILNTKTAMTTRLVVGSESGVGNSDEANLSVTRSNSQFIMLHQPIKTEGRVTRFRFKGRQVTPGGKKGVAMVIFTHDHSNQGNYIIKHHVTFKVDRLGDQELIFFGDKSNDALVDGDTELNVKFGDYVGFAYPTGSASNNHGSISHTVEYDTPQDGLYEVYSGPVSSIHNGLSVHLTPTGKYMNYNMELDITNHSYVGSFYEDETAKSFADGYYLKNTVMHHYVFPDIKIPEHTSCREISFYGTQVGLLYFTIWTPMEGATSKYQLKEMRKLNVTDENQVKKVSLKDQGYIHPFKDEVIGLAVRFESVDYTVRDDLLDFGVLDRLYDTVHGSIGLDRKTTKDAGYSRLLHTSFYGNLSHYFNLTVDYSAHRISAPDYFKPAIKLHLEYQNGEMMFGDSHLGAPGTPAETPLPYLPDTTTSGFDKTQFLPRLRDPANNRFITHVKTTCHYREGVSLNQCLNSKFYLQAWSMNSNRATLLEQTAVHLNQADFYNEPRIFRLIPILYQGHNHLAISPFDGSDVSTFADIPHRKLENPSGPVEVYKGFQYDYVQEAPVSRQPSVGDVVTVTQSSNVMVDYGIKLYTDVDPTGFRLEEHGYFTGPERRTAKELWLYPDIKFYMSGYINLFSVRGATSGRVCVGWFRQVSDKYVLEHNLCFTSPVRQAVITFPRSRWMEGKAGDIFGVWGANQNDHGTIVQRYNHTHDNGRSLGYSRAIQYPDILDVTGPVPVREPNRCCYKIGVEFGMIPSVDPVREPVPIFTEHLIGFSVYLDRVYLSDRWVNEWAVVGDHTNSFWYAGAIRPNSPLGVNNKGSLTMQDVVFFEMHDKFDQYIFWNEGKADDDFHVRAGDLVVTLHNNVFIHGPRAKSIDISGKSQEEIDRLIREEHYSRVLKFTNTEDKTKKGHVLYEKDGVRLDLTEKKLYKVAAYPYSLPRSYGTFGQSDNGFLSNPVALGDELVVLLDYTVTTSGHIVAWHYYTERTGKFVMMAWRKDSLGHLYLLGKNTVKVTSLKPGMQEFRVEEENWIYVEPGDVLGTHFHDDWDRSFVLHDYVSETTPLHNCNPCENMHAKYSRVKMLMRRSDEISRDGHVIKANEGEVTGFKRLQKIVAEIKPEKQIGGEFADTFHGDVKMTDKLVYTLTHLPLPVDGYVTTWRFRPFRKGLLYVGIARRDSRGVINTIAPFNVIQAADMVTETPEDTVVYHVPEEKQIFARAGDVVIVKMLGSSTSARLWKVQHERSYYSVYKHPNMGFMKMGGTPDNQVDSPYMGIGLAAVQESAPTPKYLEYRSRQVALDAVPPNVPYVPTWRTGSSNKVAAATTTPLLDTVGAIDYNLWSYIDSDAEFILDCAFMNKIKCKGVKVTNLARGIDGPLECTTLEVRNPSCNLTPDMFIRDTEFGWYLGPEPDKTTDPSFPPIVTFKLNTDVAPAANLQVFCDCQDPHLCLYYNNATQTTPNCKLFIK